jgi:hypothetical protein
MAPDPTDEPVLPGNALAKQSLKPCPECGENVRSGMVRCWNCGAFMNPKIQEKYQEIQSRPASPLTFSPIPEGEAASISAQAPAPADDEDDDFQLTPSRPVVQANSPTSLLSSAPAQSPAAAEDLTPIPSLEDEPAPAEKSKKSAAAPAKPVKTSDALLDIAMQDENENEKRRKKRTLTGGIRTASGGFMIFCPYGCRVEVKESHRGMSGKCPRCRAPFLVPVDPPDYSAAKPKESSSDKSGVAAAPTAFSTWVHDLHLHTVPPEKLVLKADSLLKTFTEADFGFGTEGMVVLTLPKKGGGLFGGGGDKKKEARDAILQHLKEGKPAAEIPAGEKTIYTPDQVRQMRVVQPVASRAQSMFAGVPVFGTGRIAVQLPIVSDTDPPKYVSMGITEFRKLADVLVQQFGMTDFGRDTGVPMQDQFTEHRCTYGGTFKSLNNLEFYKADPTVQIVTVGFKCGGCGLTMSEEGRAKADFGGKGGKGIAKAKCPKCQQKFGDNPLQGLPPAAPAPAAEPAAT